MLETPEWAIQSFEHLTGLQVVVHDLGSHLWPFLQPERFRHRSSYCTAIKARHDWACVHFEVTRLRQDILATPEGRYHQCHAGLIEWALPVVIHDQLACVLFAGQARASGDYQHLHHDIRRSVLDFVPKLPRVTEAKAQAILESFRQLRSRLLHWHSLASTFLQNTHEFPGDHLQDIGDRRLFIQGFLHRNHARQTTLGELAHVLHLGESRTSHLVKELFGCNYVQLLMQIRLRTAASLLRESSLSILEVCHNSGFQDVSHFHRCFQKRFATTPRKYRQLSHA